MKRIGSLWSSIVAFENLRRAAFRAARGKRQTAGVARFMERLEPEILELERRLESGVWAPGKTSSFVIRDPKERTISVAPFVDRVVHHALIAVLEVPFERRMIFESFGCRKGKGTHSALDHAQREIRRHPWFLKLDVRQCFASLDHAVVVESVARVVKDRRAIDLVEKIVRGVPVAAHARGLPIGALTSQWFANLVLDRVDHFVKETLHVPGYVRYMDDFVLFADEKEKLASALGEIELFLRDRLRLQLKEKATILAPRTEGLPFLGWRIYPRCRRLQPANRRRSIARIRHRLWQNRVGTIDAGRLASAGRSVIAHMEYGSTLELRKRLFAFLESRAPPS